MLPGHDFDISSLDDWQERPTTDPCVACGTTVEGWRRFFGLCDACDQYRSNTIHRPGPLERLDRRAWRALVRLGYLHNPELPE